MKRKIILILVFLVLIILGFGIYKFNFTNNDISHEDSIQINLHDGAYIIDGQKVTLKNGISEVEAALGSASKIITKYFGNDLKHDINDDGVIDDIFLVTQETGGSGVFYYVVALVSTPSGSIGSDGVLLGDRIAPQNIEINEKDNRKNVIVVNYADRNKGESFAVGPSLGKSIWIKLDPKTMHFGEVVQNFEGEADISKMTIDMKTWDWISTFYNNDTVVKPVKENKFTLTFKKDKTFSATTDCNNIGGEYSINDKNITFSKMISTMMYCEGSQEADFTKMLNEAQGYLFT